MYVCVYIRTYTYVSPRLMTTGGGGGGLATKSCLTLATPWTVACQASLTMGFSRQEYWSGLPFPSPREACVTFVFIKTILHSGKGKTIVTVSAHS